MSGLVCARHKGYHWNEPIVLGVLSVSRVLRLENLKAFYVLEAWGEKKVIQAVNNVTLEIPSNEVYGIAGESGCGKSTLLRTLFADIEPPLYVFSGRIHYRVDDHDIDVLSLKSAEKRKLRWTYISYIPQGSMSVFNPVKRIKSTFLDFLEDHVRGKVRENLLSLSVEHLRRVGLPPNVLDVYPHQLSGGMRQRVAIALATLLRPTVILADEPTTALDVVAQRAVLELLREVHHELGNTIVLVTHDMGIHAQITTRMAIMYAGRVVEEGPTKAIFASPLHPYTQYLIQALPHIGEKKPKEGIPGSPPSLLSPPLGCPFHPRCVFAFSLCREKVPSLEEFVPQHKVACFSRQRGECVFEGEKMRRYESKNMDDYRERG